MLLDGAATGAATVLLDGAASIPGPVGGLAASESTGSGGLGGALFDEPPVDCHALRTLVLGLFIHVLAFAAGDLRCGIAANEGLGFRVKGKALI